MHREIQRTYWLCSNTIKNFIAKLGKISFATSLFILAAGKVLADGGTVQISQEQGPFRITVFTSSAIVRAGPEDVSVLVQDRATHQPLLDGRVWISFRKLDQKPVEQAEAWVAPCCSMKPAGNWEKIEATHQKATNKLLYALSIILPESGEWEVTTEVETRLGKAVVAGKLQVIPPAPALATYWPFFALPVVSIAGYVLHFHLRKRTQKNM